MKTIIHIYITSQKSESKISSKLQCNMYGSLCQHSLVDIIISKYHYTNVQLLNWDRHIQNAVGLNM